MNSWKWKALVVAVVAIGGGAWWITSPEKDAVQITTYYDEGEYKGYIIEIVTAKECDEAKDNSKFNEKLKDLTAKSYQNGKLARNTFHKIKRSQFMQTSWTVECKKKRTLPVQ